VRQQPIPITQVSWLSNFFVRRFGSDAGRTANQVDGAITVMWIAANVVHDRAVAKVRCDFLLQCELNIKREVPVDAHPSEVLHLIERKILLATKFWTRVSRVRARHGGAVNCGFAVLCSLEGGS